MTELPLPPDPTPEEVDANADLGDMIGQLCDAVAGLDLDVAQRRKLNAASKSVAEGQGLLDDIRRRGRRT